MLTKQSSGLDTRWLICCIPSQFFSYINVMIKNLWRFPLSIAWSRHVPAKIFGSSLSMIQSFNLLVLQARFTGSLIFLTLSKGQDYRASASDFLLHRLPPNQYSLAIQNVSCTMSTLNIYPRSEKSLQTSVNIIFVDWNFDKMILMCYNIKWELLYHKEWFFVK